MKALGVFEHVVKDFDAANNPKEDEEEGKRLVEEIKDYFTYYDSVEKDFSTIANPKCAGEYRF